MKPLLCGNCRERAVVPVRVEYTAEMEHDGRRHVVSVPDLDILECRNCQTRRLTDQAYERLNDALRDNAGLLRPAQIRENREKLGLTQKQLASHLGVADATLSRWETGGQIQQRSLDRLLRLFFGFEEVRNVLADERHITRLGTGVTARAMPA